MNSAIDTVVAAAAIHETSFKGPSAGIPARHLAIVTCMDARIDPSRIFGLDPGQAHILRNAGGLASDDMLRSLVLSQRVLKTREVMLVHHTSCGLHGADEAALQAEIEADTGSTPPYEFGSFPDLDEAVRAAIARVRACPYLPHRDNVRGFVYDVQTGHLREVVL